MMHQEKYNLNWHTYSDHLKVIMREMMTTKQYADVTIVTEDQKTIKAHRNILSGCSSVFKNILELDPLNINPVIYLRGIQHSEIESILQFIYLGEAKFYAERMQELLLVAKSLDIMEIGKGVQNDADNEENVYQEETLRHNENSASYIKSELLLMGHPVEVENSIAAQYQYQFQCQLCDKRFKNDKTLKNHIESVHNGVKYNCEQCFKQFTDRGSLSKHIKAIHEGVRYECDQCGYIATQQGNLKIHIQSVHEGVIYTCPQKNCNYLGSWDGVRNHKKKVHS